MFNTIWMIIYLHKCIAVHWKIIMRYINRDCKYVSSSYKYKIQYKNNLFPESLVVRNKNYDCITTISNGTCCVSLMPEYIEDDIKNILMDPGMILFYFHPPLFWLWKYLFDALLCIRLTFGRLLIFVPSVLNIF